QLTDVCLHEREPLGDEVSIVTSRLADTPVFTQDRQHVPVSIARVDLEGDPCRCVALAEADSVVKNPLHEIDRCAIQDDHLDTRTQQTTHLSLELRRNRFESRRGPYLVKHRHIDITTA